MKKLLYILLGASVIVLNSCETAHDSNPGNEYAPDMYVSKGTEAYRMLASDTNSRYKYMLYPPANTIARGKLDYVFEYSKNDSGYKKAQAELKNPLPLTLNNLKEGKRLYNINCAVCHGELGKSDGTIVAAGKFPHPPKYQDDVIRLLPDGGKYFTVTYGKNLMGSYAPMLSPEERWKVIQYVDYLSHMEEANAAKYNFDDTRMDGDAQLTPAAIADTTAAKKPAKKK